MRSRSAYYERKSEGKTSRIIARVHFLEIVQKHRRKLVKDLFQSCYASYREYLALKKEDLDSIYAQVSDSLIGFESHLREASIRRLIPNWPSLEVSREAKALPQVLQQWALRWNLIEKPNQRAEWCLDAALHFLRKCYVGPRNHECWARALGEIQREAISSQYRTWDETYKIIEKIDPSVLKFDFSFQADISKATSKNRRKRETIKFSCDWPFTYIGKSEWLRDKKAEFKLLVESARRLGSVPTGIQSKFERRLTEYVSRLENAIKPFLAKAPRLGCPTLRMVCSVSNSSSFRIQGNRSKP